MVDSPFIVHLHASYRDARFVQLGDAVVGRRWVELNPAKVNGKRRPSDSLSGFLQDALFNFVG